MAMHSRALGSMVRAALLTAVAACGAETTLQPDRERAQLIPAASYVRAPGTCEIERPALSFKQGEQLARRAICFPKVLGRNGRPVALADDLRAMIESAIDLGDAVGRLQAAHLLRVGGKELRVIGARVRRLGAERPVQQLRSIKSYADGDVEIKQQFCDRQAMLFDMARDDFWEAHNDLLDVGFVEWVENVLGLSDSMMDNYNEMVSALDRMNTLSANYTQAGC